MNDAFAATACARSRPRTLTRLVFRLRPSVYHQRVQSLTNFGHEGRNQAVNWLVRRHDALRISETGSRAISTPLLYRTSHGKLSGHSQGIAGGRGSTTLYGYRTHTFMASPFLPSIWTRGRMSRAEALPAPKCLDHFLPV